MSLICLQHVRTIQRKPTVFLFFFYFDLAYVFPRLGPVSRFPALGAGFTFSRAWGRFHVLPRLGPVSRFPALGAGFTFSRAWGRFHVLPRLEPVAGVTFFAFVVFGQMC